MFIGQENGGDRKLTGSRLPVHGTVEIEVWDLALVKPTVILAWHIRRLSRCLILLCLPPTTETFAASPPECYVCLLPLYLMTA